jgi:hypothetical protein
MKFLFIFIILFTSVYAKVQLIKKENADSNTTFLVIGGIHGDEPGGYFAASILASHYDITSKNLWIVPNLNQASIQKNRRGIYGDMNRKFSTISKDDSDFETIQEIKKIILSKNVSLILNLHDGHGFYREKNQGNIFNPTAWGQTCVIDQCKLNQNQPFGNLNTIASEIRDNINKKLLQQHHSFNVRNTNSKFDDEAMRLSLTYFAVTNNKPAFAIESSKNLSSLSQNVFYQLVAIEEFMKIMKIQFVRKFELNEAEIEKIINEYGTLKINNSILFNFSDIKNNLSYVPLKSDENEFIFSNLLGSVEKVDGKYNLYIGNKIVTTLSPQNFKTLDNSIEKFDVKIDSKIISINKASYFSVKDDFSILKNKDYRVNVIGYQSKGSVDEAGVKIGLKSLNKNFSIDKNNKQYRVEFYKDNEFCFMSIANFK